MSQNLIDRLHRCCATCCLIFLTTFSLRAQDTTQLRLGIAFEYHPHDFRLYAQWDGGRGPWCQSVQLGIGLRKTVFQQHLNPVVGYQAGFQFAVKKFQFQPLLRVTYGVHWLPVPQVHRTIQNTEVFLSGRIGYGAANRFFLASGIGPGWEFKYDHFQEKRGSYSYWVYFFQIGFSHAF